MKNFKFVVVSVLIMNAGLVSANKEQVNYCLSKVKASYGTGQGENRQNQTGQDETPIDFHHENRQGQTGQDETPDDFHHAAMVACINKK